MPNSSPESSPGPAYIVGIGASAGGLEAIEAFFSHVSEKTDLAFVVIQHLSPDYKSLMVEILSKKTAMPVRRAEHDMEVRPGEIYLIPPKKNLTIFHGQLLLSDQEAVRGINLPIDVFLQSLAEDQGEKSVAVILSGTGSDGMRGVRGIKQAGGMIMVQDPEEAKFDGMPRAALSTGLVDFVLPAEEMPARLIAFTQHPHLVAPEPDGMNGIFSLLRERCKVDFTNYKPSTVMRRIDRRMTINRVDTTADYYAYMQAVPSEVTTLFRELLIGVTGFFRDPWVFDYLAREIIPALVKSSEGRELRLWVAGSSTGEEAYTLAMLLSHEMEEQGVTREVKIFATDIDREATQFAALGAYPESIAADIPQPFLSKYFYKKDEHFHISRSIRGMVVFAQHNLIKDPPFTGTDLISCRNLLIYLQPVLQTRVLEFFRFSLRPEGVLVLGTSETLGELSDAYSVVDSKAKIYRSKGRGSSLVGSNALTAGDTRMRDLHQQLGSLHGSFGRHAHRGSEERVLERFLDALSPEFLPVGVVVNDQLEVLHVIGDSRPYFRFPQGKPTADLDKIAVRELSIPLVTATQKAFREGKQLRFSGVRLREGEKDLVVDITVVPLPAKAGYGPLAAALLSPQPNESSPGSAGEPATYDLSREAEERITDLEQELQFSRENLQATIEELETANEELQATNEELLASNEELQSTNEELQSTNEELFTVNAEYNAKILELSELNNDVRNLINSSSIGLLLLDENLDVRRYSPAMTKILSIGEADIRRPVAGVASHLEGFDLTEKLRSVALRGETHQWEARSKDGSWFLLRVDPYLVAPEEASGVVMTAIDITERKWAEEGRDAQLQTVQFLTDLSSELLRISLSELPEGMTGALSRASGFFGAESIRLYRCGPAGVYRRPDAVSTPIPPADAEGGVVSRDLFPWLPRLEGGEVVEVDGKDFGAAGFEGMAPGPAVLVPLESSGGLGGFLAFEYGSREPSIFRGTRQLYGTVADIFCSCVERGQTHRSLSENRDRYRLLVESTDAVPWEYDIASDTWTYVAPQAEAILGYPPEAWDGVRFWMDRLHPEDQGWAADYCNRCTARGEDHVFEYRFRRPDGGYIWVRDLVTVEIQAGRPVCLRGFMIDITARRLSEDRIAALLKEKETLFKELAHRVKNNLTTLSSLLALQEDAAPEEAARRALEEARRRVETLHRVYALLNDGSIDGAIDLKEYFESLIPGMAEAGLVNSGVTISAEVAPLSLPTDSVIALGMITNELVTNCFKHAFPGGASGTITVAVAPETDESCLLRVRDDGVGFDPKRAGGNGAKGGLGLTLVEGLAGQIGGSFAIETGSEGTAVDVRFATNGVRGNGE